MGADYLSFLTELFDGDVLFMLAADNAGRARDRLALGAWGRPGRVLETGDIPFAETREFAKRVERLRALFMKAHPGGVPHVTLAASRGPRR